MEIHLVINRRTGRIYAFSDSGFAKAFIAKKKATFKKKHHHTNTWTWQYRKVEVDQCLDFIL